MLQLFRNDALSLSRSHFWEDALEAAEKPLFGACFFARAPQGALI
jgi:hypothetical protein